jgi:serine/threonine protein kinase/hemoglobin-like flavoprotein/Ran GTPase-activating protein (RanGAP) involved in mRNA processing and transport
MSEHDKERQVFETCLEIPPRERPAYLDRICGAEADLKRRILSLLEAREQTPAEESSRPTENPVDTQAPNGNPAVPGHYCPRCERSVSDPAEQCDGCGQKKPVRGWPNDGLLGRTIAGGHYRVLSRLGSGGFGVVYEVETVIGRLRRALKVLREDWAQHSSVRERFINEAVALERINHPNVARCFAAGTLDEHGEPYLLFELVEGVTLSKLIGFYEGRAARKLEPLRAVRIAKQIASGLVAAHAKHILHRDLKPANVMIVEAGTASERIKLLDFGIAKFVEADLTGTVGLIGTPAFMAPEQFSAPSQITPAVDLWQLGALLFVMLTGQTPYPDGGYSREEFPSIHRTPGEPGPLPSEVEPALAAHPSLDGLTSRLLATRPGDRPESAAIVCQELAGIEQALAPGGTSAQSALLDALCAKPSRDSWLALSRYLENQSLEVREMAEQRLSGWPIDLRRATVAWWEGTKTGHITTLWPLVRTLDLSGRALNDDDLVKIAECPALSSLRKLNLAGNSIGPKGAEALAQSQYLERLEWLDLGQNRLGNRGVQALARSPHLKSLRSFHLAGSRADARALEALGAMSPGLEELDLSDNDLGPDGAQMLVKAGFVNLKVLRLGNTRLGADGVAVLAVSPLLTNLRVLDLQQNVMGPAGVATLALSRNLAELRHLGLAQNRLGREGLQLLLSSSLESLESLDIASNGVSANGAMALASSMVARRIRSLNLQDNEISDTGVAALLGAPQLTGLSSLDISQNAITPSGIALFDGATVQLESLNLSDNILESRGAAFLSSTVAQLRVRRLLLAGTKLNVDDLHRIVQGAKGNLVELDASDNRLEAGGAAAFARLPELASIRALRLNGVHAGPSELAGLFSSPYLSNLEELSLNSNELGDDGVIELAGMTGLARLVTLSLQDNGLGPKSAAALATSPLSSHLTCLNLAYNQLGDSGAEALASGTSWHQLQELHLQTNGIGFGGAAALLTGKNLGMLQVISLGDNPLLGELDIYNLAEQQLMLVEKSFAQISGMGRQVAERFYDTLFARFPGVKPLFAHVSMSRQQQHLFTALVMIIENLRSPDALSSSLVSLGQRHVGYGVRPAYYSAFSTTLLEVLRELLAEEWTAEVEEAWTEALDAITRVVLSAHRESKSKAG